MSPAPLVPKTLQTNYVPTAEFYSQDIDTGIGMNDETIAQLFTPQLNKLIEPRSANTSVGIGLLLTKNLIEKHGGKIWVESKEQEGSSFIFSLPRNTNQENQLQEKRKAFFEDYNTMEENNSPLL